MTSTTPEHYRDLLDSLFRDRKWIVAMDVLVPAAAFAQRILQHGAEGVIAVGFSKGTGRLPDPEEVPQIELGGEAPDMMSGIRMGLDALANLPAEVLERIDAFDPERKALVIGALFSDGRAVAGRPCFGARPADWQALEDKTVIDDLWRRMGIPHAEVRVVEAERKAIRSAWRAMQGESDVVICGDNREGFNGGAQYIRWIRNERHLRAAIDFFEKHCDRVRVMPFLEGIPCSIHGIVFDDYVAALRPCEMLVLRDPDQGRFVYASAATFWQPASELVDEMRGVAKRVGGFLDEHYGYRGVFTVDGVSTEAGFRPTELNPRYGAALMRIAAGIKDFSMYLLHLAIAAREPLDYRPRDLEALLLEHALNSASGGGVQLSQRKVEETHKGGVVFEGGRWRLAVEGEESDATFALGPSPVGALLRIELDPKRTPRGPSAAPRVAQVLAMLGEHFDLGFPQMEVAPSPGP